VISVPFQVGHIQTNPWVAGEIVFCWETGGKSPQRTWTVMADGTGLRPLYPESEYEWVTHEAVISKDEVAIAIMGHRKIPGTNKQAEEGTSVSGSNPGQEAAWGPSGTREKPTGLAIVNLRTREMEIVGQTKSGSGLWHVSGSPDGRWVVYASAGTSRPTIWKISIDGGEPVEITHRVSLSPMISPDGKSIAYLFPESLDPATPPNRIAIMSFDGGEPVATFKLIPGGTVQTNVQWSPDGKSILYNSNANNITNIWSQPIDGGEPKQITDFKDSFMTGFAWSQDGKRLVCARGVFNRDAVVISENK